MMMTKNEERDLFLKYLKDIYKEIPDEFNEDTVYTELQKFYVRNNKIERIQDIKLLPIKAKLSNNYNKNRRKKYSSVYNKDTGHFYGFENVVSDSDRPFSGKIMHAIKFYVPTSPNDIYDLFEKVLDFAIKEKIKIEIKLSDVMRNDNIVIRTLNIDDAKKITDFLTKKVKINSDVNVNPFVLEKDNIGYAVDGSLSYNRVLAKLINKYIDYRCSNGMEDLISEIDFKDFTSKQVDSMNNVSDYVMKNTYKTNLMAYYDIDDENKFRDFVLISDEIIKNIDGKLTLDNISRYQSIKSVSVPDDINDRLYEVMQNHFEEKDYHDIVNYIMFYMSNYYNDNEKNMRIMEYFKTGNINYFPRCYGIRSLIDKNFSYDSLREYIMLMGREALLSASVVTYKKHGPEQLKHALLEQQQNGKLDYFTNDNDVRSYLGLIIPPQLLKELTSNIDEIITETLERVSSSNMV